MGSVTLYGGSGATTLTLDYSNGDLSPGGITFIGQSPTANSPNQLIVLGAPSANYTLSSTSLTISQSTGASSFTDTVAFTALPSFNLFSSGGTSTLEVTSGNFTFNSDLGANASVDLTVDSGATVNFGVTQHLDALTIKSGGTVTQLRAADAFLSNGYFVPGGQLLETNSLTVNGVLDLTDNDLIVSNPSSTATDLLQEQVGLGTSALPGTQSIIVSSTATHDGMTIGIAPASELAAMSSPLTSLDGALIDQTHALVARYVIPGDVNLDGRLNGSDLAVVNSNLNTITGTTPPHYDGGDIDYSGIVNGTDLGAVNTHLNLIDGVAPVAITVGVPHTITLSTTTPAGATIFRWDINWGDGEFDSYLPSISPTASHTYTSNLSTGVTLIQMTATLVGGAIYSGQATAVAITPATGITALNIPANSSSNAFSISNSSGYTIITETNASGGSVGSWSNLQVSLLSINITGDSAGTVTVDFSNGNPLPPAGLFTDGALLNITDAAANAILFTTATAAVVSNAEIRHPATTAVTFIGASPGNSIEAEAGTITIASYQDPTGATVGPIVLVNNQATVWISNTLYLSTMTILAGGTARMTQQGSHVLVAYGMHILGPDSYNTSGGVFDLGDNALIVRANINPAFGLARINGYLGGGYDNGKWDGEGTTRTAAAIISSAALADPTDPLTLGCAPIGTNASNGQLNLTTFAGQLVYAGDVVVKLTQNGDANLDGSYDSSDLAILNNGYANHLTGWSNGDFNYNRSVGLDDYDLLYGTSQFPAGSLAKALSDGVIDSIAGVAPGLSTQQIYSSADNRNSNNFLTNVDVTSRAEFTTLPTGNPGDNNDENIGGVTYTPEGVGCLISPQTLLVAYHTGRTLGETWRFVDPSGNVYLRHIISFEPITPNTDGTSLDAPYNYSSSTATTDLEVAFLNSPLPSSIKPTEILPSNYQDYLPAGFGIPVVTTHSNTGSPFNASVGIDTWTGMASSITNGVQTANFFQLATILNIPVNSELALWQIPLIGGDSGGPAYAILDDEAILLGTLFGGLGQEAGFPSIADSAMAINATMTALSSAAGSYDYQLQTVILSGYPPNP